MTDVINDDQAYDANVSPVRTETYTLEHLIELGCQAALLECRVAMPCRVTAVNADGSVNVLPGLKTRFVGRQAEPLPELQYIPVGHIQGQDYRIQFPVAVGDTGYCLTMDRAIDAWLAADGSPQSPGDVRAHHLSDAIYVPMLATEGARHSDAGTDMVLQNGALTMRLQKTGQLRVQNGSQELVNVLDQLLQANIALVEQIKALQILTTFGPAPVLATSVAALQQVEVQLQGIQTKADTFLSR